MINALVFDCFGVLYASPFARFAGTYIPEKRRTEYEDLYKQYDHGFISHYEFVNGQALLADIPFEQAEEELFSGFQVDHTLLELIRELRYDYKTGLLTNISEETWRVIYPELDGVFDIVAPSFETKLVKPAREAYLNATHLLDLPPYECIMIDDRVENTLGAEAVGMHTILYENIHTFQKDLEIIFKA